MCAAFAGADHGDIGDVKFFYGVCGAEKEGVEKRYSGGGDGGRGIRTDDKRWAHLKTGRQAEILDYNYFKSRMPEMVITDIQAEVFDFRKNRVVPFAVKRLEFSFGNGKKVDMTDRVSVLSLDRLAG